MILTRLRLALALATLLAAFSPALASDPYCLGTQCYPTMAVIDPATGKPVSPAGGGSSGGGTAADQTGSNATDGQATSTANQHALAFGYIFNGTTWDRIRGTGGAVNTTDQNAAQTITAPGTSGAKSQSVQASDGTLIAKDASVQAVKTALGSPFQAGGSIGNTAFGISGQLPAFAATPTFNIGTAPTLTVQGTVTANQGGAPWSTTISGTLPAFAAIPVFKIDQTTPGTTNKVSIGTDGVVTNSPSTGATMTTSQPSVTTTAAALTFAGSIHREIYNPASSTASIFIGGTSGVTTGTGWEVPPGSSYDVSRYSGSVYAVAASAQTVRLISY